MFGTSGITSLNINIPYNTVPKSQNVDCLTIMHFHNPLICLSKLNILYSWDTVLKGFLHGLYSQKYLIFLRKWRAFFALLSNWWEIFTLLKPSFSLPYFTRSALMILKATTTFTRIWKGIIKKDFCIWAFSTIKSESDFLFLKFSYCLSKGHMKLPMWSTFNEFPFWYAQIFNIQFIFLFQLCTHVGFTRIECK